MARRKHDFDLDDVAAFPSVYRFTIFVAECSISLSFSLFLSLLLFSLYLSLSACVATYATNKSVLPVILITPCHTDRLRKEEVNACSLART